MEIQLADAESGGVMNPANPRLRVFREVVLIAFAVVGITAAVFRNQQTVNKDDQAKTENRVVKKDKNQLHVDGSYELGLTEVEGTKWHPPLFVDGRVLANPDATLEIRAPFAGVLHSDAKHPNFRLDAPAEAEQVLARLEARFSPFEKLDINAKSAEAEARWEGTKSILKIREERQHRLDLLPSGSVSRGTLDDAAILLAEARTQRDIALTQWNLWKQALESVGKKSIVVTIQAPIKGRIAEIGAQPGSNVEAGQLLLRIVDYRRVLVRLDFPFITDKQGPPADIEIAALTSLPHEAPVRWPAKLRGAAPGTEIGLQKSSYLYEIKANSNSELPGWRPGLFVTAVVPDPAKSLTDTFILPPSSLLIHQGRTLVYVQISPPNLKEKKRGIYECTEIQVLGREGDKLYVAAPNNWLGDEKIVSKNAQVLLSEEFRRVVDDD